MYKLVKINTGLFNIEENFWKLNPQLKYMPPFRSLYQLDNGEEHSSKTAWCIWLLQDPSYENKVYRQPPETQNETLHYYYPKFDIDSEIVQEIMAHYDELALSSIARSFKKEDLSMAQRSEFLGTTAYTLDYPMTDEETGAVVTDAKGNPIIVKGTAVQLDTIRKNSTIIYKQYKEIANMFEEEQTGARVHGGRQLSPRERGGLQQNHSVDGDD